MDSADRAPDALCAVHSETAAVTTCLRCGNFLCASCVSDVLEGHCVPCADRLHRGRVAQLPWFAIVMMVHGGVLVLMGLSYALFGGLFMIDLSRMPLSPLDDPSAAQFPGILLIGVGIVGAAHFVPGVLQLVAGWRARRHRSRGLAIASLFAGTVTLLGCYCAPTSLALLVWGLLVLLDEGVRDRFSAARPAKI